MTDLDDRWNTALDAIDSPAAALDQHGVVRAVNEAWTRFAVDNGYDVGDAGGECGMGTSYHTWDDDPADAEARQASAGVLDVIEGRADSFQMVYPCHSPAEARWFRLVVAPLDDLAPRPVLTVHVRLDEQHGEAEYHAPSPPRLPVVCAWCGTRERLADGRWREVEPPATDARAGAAVSHGICPACVATFD
ncbi:MAG: hypothetical protein WD225_10950 [Ilumatobacteraceae bacterium]